VATYDIHPPIEAVHRILIFMKRLISMCFQSLQNRFVGWTHPSTTSLMLGSMTDQARSKSELVAENALLRKPLIILRRHVKRPMCTKADRMLLVLLARAVRPGNKRCSSFRKTTLLRGPRQGFRLYWKYKSRAASSKPKISAETVALRKRDGKGQSTAGGHTVWTNTAVSHP
jgi:hypothetical protein